MNVQLSGQGVAHASHLFEFAMGHCAVPLGGGNRSKSFRHSRSASTIGQLRKKSGNRLVRTFPVYQELRPLCFYSSFELAYRNAACSSCHGNYSMRLAFSKVTVVDSRKSELDGVPWPKIVFQRRNLCDSGFSRSTQPPANFANTAGASSFRTSLLQCC